MEVTLILIYRNVVHVKRVDDIITFLVRLLTRSLTSDACRSNITSLSSRITTLIFVEFIYTSRR
jgi:hypothetical protein